MASGSTFGALNKETPHLGLKFGEQAILYFAPGIEDDGPLRTQLRQFEPDGFAHAAPDAIARDGFAQSFGGRETDAWSGRRQFGKNESGKQGTGVTGPPVVNSSEIARSQQPDTFGKAWYSGYLSELTDSFLRPMARRRESTAWPSEVFMRVRKPCVLTRRRLFG